MVDIYDNGHVSLAEQMKEFDRQNPFERVLGKKIKEELAKTTYHDSSDLNIVTMFNLIRDYHVKLGHANPVDEWERMQMIRNCCLALFMEAAELTDSFAWKPWKYDEESDTDNACREIVDIIFFMVEIMTLAGITTEQFIAKFNWILANNLDRLKNGYSLVKGGEDNEKD